MSVDEPSTVREDVRDEATLRARTADVEATLQSSGYDIGQLSTCRMDSLRPKPGGSQPAGDAVARLPEITSTNQTERMAQIELHEVIGGGGIGYVRAAKQIALEREVAVKALHNIDGKPIDEPATLLREARVQGALEHPQIVPVHLVGVDEQAQPLIVMKRIYGVPWSQLLGAAPERLPGAGDALERHLRILIQVCNAVEFAHDQRIIHRDIKPGNVIVGTHGEVYLIDWGLAVCFGEDRFDLQRAEHIRHIAGTPAYMAPEMADPATGTGIGVASDVYLLGGCLHSILSGQPRHAGADTVSELVAATLSEPCEHPAKTPEALATICQKATQRDASERFDSVASFRDALDAFLVHRASIRLTTDALERAIGLFAYLEADENEPRLAYERFNRARFGLQEALRDWPENGRAIAGLQTLLVRMIEYALGIGDDRMAASLLDELPTPSEQLGARLQVLYEQQAIERKRVAALEALAYEVDPDVGRRARVRYALLIVVPGLVTFSAIGILERLAVFAPAHGTGMTLALCFATALIALRVATRKGEMVTRLNTQMYAGLMVAGIGPIILIAGLWYAAVPYPITAALVQLLWAVMTATLAPLAHRGLVPASLGLALGFVVTVLLPEWHWFIVAASTSLALLASILPWVRPARP